ncbi:MAG: ATP-binding cassette domain-containing protein, partial [Candidatus Puniceispirillales bacterium]
MLEIRNVTFSYVSPPMSDDDVLRFHLTVKEQSITVIEGPSGIGKSTLLHLIAGFLVPLSGDILWQGQSICGLLPAERPVSMLFQNDNLFPHLDVWTNIAIGLSSDIRNKYESRMLIEQSLSDLGIAGMEKRMIDTLSGGQQQRVALARALVRSRILPSDESGRRSLLLLDEPFSNIDTQVRFELIADIRRIIKNQQVSAVFVTHS